MWGIHRWFEMPPRSLWRHSYESDLIDQHEKRSCLATILFYCTIRCPQSTNHALDISKDYLTCSLVILVRYVFDPVFWSTTLSWAKPRINTATVMSESWTDVGREVILKWLADCPSAVYIRHWIGSALVQIMACRLFGARPLCKKNAGLLSIGPLSNKLQWNLNRNTMKRCYNAV